MLITKSNKGCSAEFLWLFQFLWNKFLPLIFANKLFKIINLLVVLFKKLALLWNHYYIYDILPNYSTSILLIV